MGGQCGSIGRTAHVDAKMLVQVQSLALTQPETNMKHNPFGKGACFDWIVKDLEAAPRWLQRKVGSFLHRSRVCANLVFKGSKDTDLKAAKSLLFAWHKFTKHNLDTDFGKLLEQGVITKHLFNSLNSCNIAIYRQTLRKIAGESEKPYIENHLEIHVAGKEAFHDGKDQSFCPYRRGTPQRNYWIMGWYKAKGETTKQTN